jgi:hypothetical protein
MKSRSEPAGNAANEGEQEVTKHHRSEDDDRATSGMMGRIYSSIQSKKAAMTETL